MSNHIALLEITCDAPSYEIVRACEDVGFCSPLDVRLPNLRDVEFAFLDGGKADFLIGQCPRCRTMFWHEV